MQILSFRVIQVFLFTKRKTYLMHIYVYKCYIMVLLDTSASSFFQPPSIFKNDANSFHPKNTVATEIR